MPHVEIDGKIPTIEIPQHIYHQMRAVAFAADSCGIAMFLKAKPGADKFILDELYVPRQYSSDVYNIVDEKELLLLGKEYFACVRANISGGSVDMTKTQDEIFSKMFYGVDNFIFGFINKAGKIRMDIRLEDVIFRNCECKILNPIPKEIIDAEKKQVGKSMIPWKFSDGYTQVKRPFYKTPKIIEEKMSWLDVVVGEGAEDA